MQANQESVERKVDALLSMLEKMRDPEPTARRGTVLVQPRPTPKLFFPLAQPPALVEEL